MSINSVNLTGNLTRDAEFKATVSGAQILIFSLAVTDRRKNNSTGEWEDYPNYIDCVLFGNRAASLSERLVKGLRVAVSGKLRYRSWEDESGAKRSKIEVVVDELDFISRQQKPQQPAVTPQQEYLTDDDIPF